MSKPNEANNGSAAGGAGAGGLQKRNASTSGITTANSRVKPYIPKLPEILSIMPPSIEFSLAKIKDKKINEIKKIRPENIQYVTFSNSIYTTYFTLLSNLRYKFVENNKDIKYYMIKLSFPTNYSKSIFYKNLESPKWQLRTRVLVDGHPCCV